MITLNGIVKRIKDIALGHSQLRGFHQGFISDYTDSSDKKYGVCILQNSGGAISTQGRFGTVNFKMFLLDLVHVSEDSKSNELEVQSDMMGVAMDLIRQFDDSQYQDWKVETNNQVQFVSEEGPEITAGVSIDFSISGRWDINKCAVPTLDAISVDSYFVPGYVATGYIENS